MYVFEGIFGEIIIGWQGQSGVRERVMNESRGKKTVLLSAAPPELKRIDSSVIGRRGSQLLLSTLRRETLTAIAFLHLLSGLRRSGNTDLEYRTKSQEKMQLYYTTDYQNLTGLQWYLFSIHTVPTR